MASSSLRPFSSLGVRPFLWASPQDLTALQREYIRRSRQVHPDTVVNESEEERQEAEARSAQLNLDYSKLRDFWKLVDAVAHGLKSEEEGDAPANNGACERLGATGAPPELAADYFELQENLADLGPSNPQVQAQLRDFAAKVDEKLVAAEKKVQDFAQKFPFAGPGEALPSWTEADLKQLRQLLEQVRYYRRFRDDIRSRSTTK